MTHKLYDLVVLASDAYVAEGAVRGMRGYIIEIYSDGMCEVEFSNRDTGETISTIVAKPDEITPVVDSESSQ